MTKVHDGAGNLAAGHKRADHGQGLDWDAIRKARDERLEAEVARGIMGPEHEEYLRLKALDDKARAAEQRALEASMARQPKEARYKTSGTGTGEDTPRDRRVGARTDVGEMVRLYVDEGMAPSAIAKELHVGYETVIKWLKREQVFDPNRHRGGGRPKRGRDTYSRKTHCVNGHDLTLPGAARELTTKDGAPNGRECVECSRKRKRDAWHRAQARKKAAE